MQTKALAPNKRNTATKQGTQAPRFPYSAKLHTGYLFILILILSSLSFPVFSNNTYPVQSDNIYFIAEQYDNKTIIYPKILASQLSKHQKTFRFPSGSDTSQSVHSLVLHFLQGGC
ncbi:MAG: hypothetical protein GQ582_10805 [Methyloprofundus sp.]|nr:hypothetical protein [Methyloprofundus sp.]